MLFIRARAQMFTVAVLLTVLSIFLFLRDESGLATNFGTVFFSTLAVVIYVKLASVSRRKQERTATVKKIDKINVVNL